MCKFWSFRMWHRSFYFSSLCYLQLCRYFNILKHVELPLFYMPPQFVFQRCFNKRFVSIIWIFITLNKYCYTTFLAWTNIGCIHFVCFLTTCFVICSLTLNTVSRNFIPFIMISLCFFIRTLRSCCVFFFQTNTVSGSLKIKGFFFLFIILIYS